MKFISDWIKQEWLCTKCGTNKSVKWTQDGIPYCNRCILSVGHDYEIEDRKED